MKVTLINRRPPPFTLPASSSNWTASELLRRCIELLWDIMRCTTVLQLEVVRGQSSYSIEVKLANRVIVGLIGSCL